MPPMPPTPENEADPKPDSDNVSLSMENLRVAEEGFGRCSVDALGDSAREVRGELPEDNRRLPKTSASTDSIDVLALICKALISSDFDNKSA